jgi:hypothetical protein
MKELCEFLQIEKYFDFLKMDKKKCPKIKSQNTPY